ncbi:lytic polysaccharide monooxygenase [Providencia rettgeri]|uniref:lytic polysaccharide monooxygenase n=1 Tax=Providencia rettgeri TaxID=587 RepID=UPI002360F233|nr:lytic polysaccharide monooxygenase [Providencia rettgeri]ELR5152977.1 lytic polysaccharide monooxygenase [Providencia rettgeri]
MKQLLLAPILFCCSFLVWSHGYVEFPESRAYLCKKQDNKNCGPVQYEPQSVEGPKGFPEKGPLDGKIASAGLAQFKQLDEQTPQRWKHLTQSSPKIDFRWRLTAIHKTTKWEYFITKLNWNPNAPLSRAQFELKPFCKYERIEIPQEIVQHNCVLPLSHQGYHTILAVWTIDDTPNAFYQAIDLDIYFKEKNLK